MTGDRRARGILRGAAVLNLGMHSALLVMSPLLVVTGAVRRHTATQITFALFAGALLAAVHVRHLRAAARGERPAAWPLTLLLQAALVYAPLLWLGQDWGSTQLPLTASIMLLFPRPWGMIVGLAELYLLGGSAYVFLNSQTLSPRDTIFETVYFAVTVAVFALMLYGTARLVRLVNELHRSRAELAEIAVDEERVRVSRDLHDLLGQSLSAISLKGDLATRLLSLDPVRARHEITSLTELARSTLRDVRAVTRDEHQVTLQHEIAAAQGLLGAAGVDTRVNTDGTDRGLSDDAQQVLAWAVREATTNVLRHSDATTCTITLTHAVGTISLNIRNDGVRQPALSDGSGLAGLKNRAARAGGSASAHVSDDEFQLRVDLPDATTLAQRPSA